MRVSPLLMLALAVLTSLSVAHAHAPAGPYTLELVDEAGHGLRTYSHRGRTYVLGKSGQRYLLRVRNGSGQRIEVVASVDGRDVLDGKPANVAKRGYIVEPWSQVEIDGFRLSNDEVAAFRFSSVARSYAAQMGSARDVGVIGAAIFTQRPPPPPPVEVAKKAERAASAPPSSSGTRGAEGSAARSESRPGLGTEFGEAHASHVSEVAFERASAHPLTVLSVRYNDRSGLRALGIDVDGDRGELWTRETAEPFRPRPEYSQPPPHWNR